MTRQEYQQELDRLRKLRRNAIRRRMPDEVIAAIENQIKRLQIEQLRAMRANGKA
jgi:hypothetical protein